MTREIDNGLVIFNDLGEEVVVCWDDLTDEQLEARISKETHGNGGTAGC